MAGTTRRGFLTGSAALATCLFAGNAAIPQSESSFFKDIDPSRIYLAKLGNPYELMKMTGQELIDEFSYMLDYYDQCLILETRAREIGKSGYWIGDSESKIDLTEEWILEFHRRHSPRNEMLERAMRV